MRLLAWLLALGLAWGCGPGGAIRTQAQFEAALVRARELSAEHLRAFEDGRDPGAAARMDLARARRLYADMMAFDPGRFSLYVGAARIEAALDNRAGTLRMVRRALENLPYPTTPASRLLTAEAYHLMALTAFREAQYDAAVARARIAVAIEPDSPRFRTMLASALLEAGRRAEARRHLDRVLDRTPGYGPAVRLDRLFEEALLP
jgi:tetratricopeptide (TPR) repeat protein